MGRGYRPKLPKTDRTPTSYSPNPGPPLPHHRQKKFTDRPLVYLSDGRTLAQGVLPPLPGQVGFAGDRPQDGSQRPRPAPDNAPEGDHAPYDFGPIFFDGRGADAPSAEDSRHSRKRENQTTRWLQNIVPLLIPIYIDLVQKTDNLRTLATLQPVESVCTCTAEVLSGRNKVKHLKISVLRWDRTSNLPPKSAGTNWRNSVRRINHTRLSVLARCPAAAEAGVFPMRAVGAHPGRRPSSVGVRHGAVPEHATK
jgi:hypothetical protein